jgi:hypothetical protein
VDGDGRFVLALEVTFVKTAKVSFEEGFLRAVEVDADAAHDVYYIDAGREWAVIAYALEAQGLKFKVVRSSRNTKVERPWGDWNTKCVALLLAAVSNLERDGTTNTACAWRRSWRCRRRPTSFARGADEFRERYNEHNCGAARRRAELAAKVPHASGGRAGGGDL